MARIKSPPLPTAAELADMEFVTALAVVIDASIASDKALESPHTHPVDRATLEARQRVLDVFMMEARPLFDGRAIYPAIETLSEQAVRLPNAAAIADPLGVLLNSTVDQGKA